MTLEKYFSPHFTIHDGYLVGIEKKADRIIVSVKDRDSNDFLIGILKELSPVIVSTGMIFPVGLGSLSCYPVPGDIFPTAFIETQLMYNLEDRLISYDRTRWRLLMSINTWDGSYLFFLIRKNAVASLGTILFSTTWSGDRNSD